MQFGEIKQVFTFMNFVDSLSFHGDCIFSTVRHLPEFKIRPGLPRGLKAVIIGSFVGSGVVDNTSV